MIHQEVIGKLSWSHLGVDYEVIPAWIDQEISKIKFCQIDHWCSYWCPVLKEFSNLIYQFWDPKLYYVPQLSNWSYYADVI